ncbi:MAG: hypothetical protein C3L25_06050 [Candidatus Sedimenticola endophacoides]|uniref:DUF4340 domain-containing protein n=1 Tax=Candidatus Sedimenticola endophacoides TaxID=2548426 RepID=A0A6N4DT19_9GAMM|nr:MAG: hypothetical protein B0D89_12605 [Candidatus Sedimenticola endophacoides]OQX48920.1 MAG: hypothetical protein B0D87_03125 [Candidatus Sedimenticola endophacoides]PUE00125.1 MAG: hypothetical protein C3L24_09675 [Candidatus Sedimenticola endophacoides]PUE00263.1 MAG: hypothetical protein C3L26_06370 [Candidatus Sedimenticola endophacoides]PUE03933.1 MAG: hypothetical protein C3L25_06050 [Candidatus Sedimenticola endophacoides]
MNKTVKILAVLLAAQLLLAAGIGLSDRGVTATNEPVALVSFDAEKIDRITLEGPEDAKVTLERNGSDWVLPDLGEFPANSNKVKQLFERLKALRSGTPIATSGGARERFKVSDEQFERRITLSEDDDTVARLFLGSSPGMRLIHARNEASDAIHAVKMAVYDVPVKASDWEDKSVLTLPKTQITAINVNGLHLQRSSLIADSDKATEDSSQSPTWQADGLGEGQQLKASAADKLAGLLADLQFEKVLGREAKDEYGLTEPVLELSLSRDGETLRYRAGKAKDTEEYTLKVSSRPEYFRLASYKAKPLIESANLEKLIEAISAAAGEAESAGDVEEDMPAPDANGEGAASE